MSLWVCEKQVWSPPSKHHHSNRLVIHHLKLNHYLTKINAFHNTPKPKPPCLIWKRRGKKCNSVYFRRQTNVAVSRWKRKRGNGQQRTVFWEWNGNGWPSDVTMCVCVTALSESELKRRLALILKERVAEAVDLISEDYGSLPGPWPQSRAQSEKTRAECAVKHCEGRCEDLTASHIFSTSA